MDLGICGVESRGEICDGNDVVCLNIWKGCLINKENFPDKCTRL